MGEHADTPNNLNEIARFALAMYDHGYFFSVRRDLSINFVRDMNGGGMQGLFIKKRSDEKDSIQVVFDYTYSNDDDFLYEADLWTDQQKDYEPTLNRGKHRFKAYRFELEISLDSDEIHGLAPIFPYTFYHLTHDWFVAADIPVGNDIPVHYADAIRCNVRRPPQGSLPLLTRRASA